MTSLSVRMRRALGYSAMTFAFGGGLALTGASLAPNEYVSPSDVEQALDVFLAVMPTAAAVIMWFKLKGIGDD